MLSAQNITLKCETVIRLAELEAAGISYVPCGQVNGKDQPLLAYSAFWDKREQVTLKTYGTQASAWRLSDMTGVQIMTGAPTYLRGVALDHYLVDIDIEKHLIETYPDTLEQIVTHYRDNCTGTPCIVQTKSGGLRLSAFCQYLENKRSFDDGDGMLLEIFSKKGLSRLDHRYAMVEGSVLEIPILPGKTPQTIDGIMSELLGEVLQPIPSRPGAKKSNTEPQPAANRKADSGKRKVVSESQIGDLQINWDAAGRSQYFSAKHCRATVHRTTRDTVRFTKHEDGSIDGKCFNCEETWWEVPPQRSTTPPNVQKLIAQAPPLLTDIHTPAFPHWTPEERTVVRDILGRSPDAGWNESTPAFATRYENLYPMTGEFACNGQPKDIERHRMWSTQFGQCEKCGNITADWVDRYRITAGRYCNSCHEDTPLGSYLEWELARKLPNAIISEYQGYLGDDPEFEDFRLWEPERLTHLGAGMCTGKSTELSKAIVALVQQSMGIGIIASPRISLARFLAYQLRKRHGHNAWGLWHEGSASHNQFIGTYGAIVCLPSLGRAVSEAYAQGLDASSLYLAIDEIDFGYSLLSLAIHQASAVKKCLSDIFLATGLVVSGQTESTLALEAFASELGCEHIQGFYNTAPPADGLVEMRKYPATEGKNARVLAGAVESIDDALTRSDHNLYVFCSSRRDGDIIAERFRDFSPVSYNAYTKGDTDCDNVLKNQRLPDRKRLFIGTSAAGVGISILDPKAKTVIVAGLNHGSRGTSMLVQKSVRDRGRRGVEMHYTDYNSALPLRPRETEAVSLYHEETKRLENQHAHLSRDAVKKTSRAMALSTLADHQIEAYVQYQLGTVGNMEVVQTAALPPQETVVDWVREHRRASIERERRAKCESAIAYLAEREIYTSREIRVRSNQGSFTQAEQIAHAYANGLACAVGWDDSADRTAEDPFAGQLDADAIGVAIALAGQHIQPERLENTRRGYLAVHYTQWVTAAFNQELEQTHAEYLEAGLGREITSVTDDRFLGVVLRVLLEKLTGEVFTDAASLAGAIRDALNTMYEGQTVFGRIEEGGLGAKAYRKARFLKDSKDDAFVINWARTFIKEHYPATLSKRGSQYSLVHDKQAPLLIESYKCWLSQYVDSELPELDLCFEEIRPEAELREQVQARRKAGATFKTIAAELDVDQTKAKRWCQDINPAKETVREKAAKKRAEKDARIQKARARRKEGATIEAIKAEFNIALSTAHDWCKGINSAE